MPSIQVAGTIVAKPKCEAFPVNGRPRCEVRVRVEDNGNAVIYRVIGFEEQTSELQTLVPGDSVAIQGQLVLESKDQKIVSLFVVALQVMALRKRSPNRMPVGSAPRAAAL